MQQEGSIFCKMQCCLLLTEDNRLFFQTNIDKMTATVITTTLVVLLLVPFIYSSLVSISFGLQNACSREDVFVEPNLNRSTATISCTAMSALLSLSAQDPTFDQTITSYVNDKGQTVALNHTIRIQARTHNSSLELPVQWERNLYNALELHVPNESCAIALGVGSCYDTQTKPPWTSAGDEHFVLCCLNHGQVTGVRATGAYCLRYQYDQIYEQFKFAIKGNVNFVQNVTIAVTIKGQTRTFAMNTLQVVCACNCIKF